MRLNKLVLGLLISSLITTASMALEKETQNFSTINTDTSKKAPSELHMFDSFIEVGLGYNSNPFLTPDKPYNDYTNSGGGALVTPNVTSGMFVPLSFKADYEYRLKQDIRLLADLNFSAKKFIDSALSNADESKSQTQIGVRFKFNKYKSETNKIEFKVFTGFSDKIYVDHDDGSAKVTSGGDQSNRYKYKKTGLYLAYTYDFKKLDFLLRALQENRDYETPATWSSLDHKYTRLKTQIGYQLVKDLRLQAYYEYSIRDYAERKSYEIVGTNISLVNPGVNFSYNDIKLSAEYKHSKKYKIDLDYFVSQRKDDNVGYADYMYNKLTLSNRYNYSKKLQAYLKLNYHVYNYDNAYAYDTSTTLDKKEADGHEINFTTDYKYTKNLLGSFDLEYKNESSTDKRYEYKQTTATVNVKYIF